MTTSSFARVILTAVLAASLSSSSPAVLIEGAPSTYVPGSPIVISIRLPAITNLGAYHVDLVLESHVGMAGSDFYFDSVASVPAATGYVFPSAANYFSAANVDAAMRHRITLTDFDFVGVDALPGVNDRVADIVIQTSPTFAGQMSLFIDADALILDTPAIDPTPVVGFEGIQSSIRAQDSLLILPIPEPASLWLALAAAGALSAARVFRR